MKLLSLVTSCFSVPSRPPMPEWNGLPDELVVEIAKTANALDSRNRRFTDAPNVARTMASVHPAWKRALGLYVNFINVTTQRTADLQRAVKAYPNAQFVYVDMDKHREAVDLTPLAQLKRLSFLSLRRSTRITDHEFKTLRLHPEANLEHLDLNGCVHLSAQGLAHLRHLPKLTALDLTKCAISDEQLAQVACVSTLRTLDLSQTRVKGPGLAYLEPLTQLKELNLSGCAYINNASLEYVGRLTGLQNLTLPTWTPRLNINDIGLAHLSKLHELRELEIGGLTQTSPTGIVSLRELQKLERLVVHGAIDRPDDVFEAIGTLSQLEKLSLFGLREVSTTAVAHLCNLTKLKSVTFQNPTLGDAALNQLERVLFIPPRGPSYANRVAG
ncbi:MAG TPA: hypothetical protein VFS42_00660 [Burkholderiaceae bacterium]|nr:hypothetical protein [Burkholderiaceae bacterium]